MRSSVNRISYLVSGSVVALYLHNGFLKCCLGTITLRGFYDTMDKKTDFASYSLLVTAGTEFVDSVSESMRCHWLCRLKKFSYLTIFMTATINWVTVV